MVAHLQQHGLFARADPFDRQRHSACRHGATRPTDRPTQRSIRTGSRPVRHFFEDVVDRQERMPTNPKDASSTQLTMSKPSPGAMEASRTGSVTFRAEKPSLWRRGGGKLL
jgi:hypothetical protein